MQQQKTLSKAANHIAKKDKSGVINLINEKQIDKILSEIKINDVWGVGRQLTKFYINNEINTAHQLKNISNSWIKKKHECFRSTHRNGVKRIILYFFRNKS